MFSRTGSQQTRTEIPFRPGLVPGQGQPMSLCFKVPIQRWFAFTTERSETDHRLDQQDSEQQCRCGERRALFRDKAQDLGCRGG